MMPLALSNPQLIAPNEPRVLRPKPANLPPSGFETQTGGPATSNIDACLTSRQVSWCLQDLLRSRRTDNLLELAIAFLLDLPELSSSRPFTLALPCTTLTVHDSARTPLVLPFKPTRVHPSPPRSIGMNLSLDLYLYVVDRHFASYIWTSWDKRYIKSTQYCQSLIIQGWLPLVLILKYYFRLFWRFRFIDLLCIYIVLYLDMQQHYESIKDKMIYIIYILEWREYT